MDKLDIIMGQIAELRAEQRADVKGLHTKLDRLFAEGCSKAPSHDDHEKRLRVIEVAQEQLRGAAWMAGKVAVVVSVVVSMAMSWLKGRGEG
jgi:hypothetical protein